MAQRQKQYLVKWEIDITASSPEEAAKQALTIQRDKNSEALVFDVYEHASNSEYRIDLIDGIISKDDKIKYIKNTISEYGMFTTAEAEADTSPAINCLGDMSILIEEFNISQCVAFTYVHSTCTCETNMFYEDLDEEVIDQIYELVQGWEASQEELIED